MFVTIAFSFFAYQPIDVVIAGPQMTDLEKFELELKKAMSSDVKLINLIGKYILRHKGKFFRPILRNKKRDLTQSCFDGIRKAKYNFKFNRR